MGEFEMLQTEMHELSESVTDYWFLSPEAIEDARYVKSRINPDLPTIALCTSNVNSAELLTLPQVQPREPRANILMLTLSDLCEIFVDDGVTYARSGFVLDDTGAIRHGYFDEPLRIDSIEERQLAAHTSRELNESGCTVYNPSDLSELMRSKDATKHIYEGLLPFAPGIVVHDNTASSMESIYDFIELEGAHSRIVVKPSRGIQGVDVSIKLCTDTESISQEVQRLLGQNQSVIIERFIEPFPITEDGEELDVTLRTVSVGCIDEHALEHMMVARPAKKGRPVTVDENEHYYTSQWLFNKANKQGIDAKSVRDQIASIHSVIRQSGLGTFACDMIIDQIGKVWLIEINTGPIGALDMICMAVESADGRLELLRKITSYMKPPEVKKGFIGYARYWNW